MKKILYWGIPAVILIACVTWRFIALGAAKTALTSQKKSGGNSPAVAVATATSRSIQQSQQSVANVESPFKVEISPKLAGRIEFLQVREGDLVTPGQILLKIDPSDLRGAVLQQEASVAEARSRLAQAKLTQDATNVGVTSQIQQQQAGLQSAQANFNQVRQNYDAQVAGAQSLVSAAQSTVANAMADKQKEEASLNNAQTKFDRSNKLYNEGFIAAQDLDDVRTALEVQKKVVVVAAGLVDAANSQLQVQQQNLLITKRKGLSDIAASRALVDQALASLRLARANRSQTPAYKENLAALQSQVDASIALVNQAQAKLSDTIVTSSITGTVTARKADPGALASPGTPVLEIQYLDWLYVTATLPLEEGARIHEGDSAQITVDALPGQTFVGPVTNINPAADPTSRQFGIKVRLENSKHVLRPGMYGRVTIVTSKVNASVVVPLEAIQRSADGTNTVSVVDSNRQVHIHKVKLGVADTRGIQVVEGVNPGDTVVVLTFNPLKDKQKVRITTPNPSAKSETKGKTPTP